MGTAGVKKLPAHRENMTKKRLPLPSERILRLRYRAYYIPFPQKTQANLRYRIKIDKTAVLRDLCHT